MHCPSCSYTLQKLEVTTNSGGKFSVDHCGRCGGTWFDPYEINRIPFHEVTRLAHITVLPSPRRSPDLIGAKAGQIPLLCPRCHKELIPSHYESVPKGVRMLRCPKCGGIWATQKALEVFKKHQQETVKEYKTGTVAFPSLSVVFVPALLILLLLASTFITVTGLQEAQEGRIRAGQLISEFQTVSISLTKTAVTFTTKTPLKTRIYYGQSSFELIPQTISSKPSTTHGILLTNLQPNTTYIYYIELEDEQGRKIRSELKSFRT